MRREGLAAGEALHNCIMYIDVRSPGCREKIRATNTAKTAVANNHQSVVR